MPTLILVSVIAAGLTGCLVGLGLRTSLGRLTYRIIGPRHDERDRPHPGSRWWVPVALALVWLTLATAFAQERWPWLVLWLPVTAIGVWLAAVDLDVQRLPDKVHFPLAVYAAIAGALLCIFGWGDWRTALGGAAGAGLLFGFLHVISRGRLGFGDVKLVVVLGWCLGLMGLSPVFYGLMLASLLGIVYSLITRAKTFAFGPWLLLGAAVSAALTGFAWAGAIPLPL
jgi:leader peptidase (prepilin peptidase)/N-methyltransferase